MGGGVDNDTTEDLQQEIIQLQKKLRETESQLEFSNDLKEMFADKVFTHENTIAEQTQLIETLKQQKVEVKSEQEPSSETSKQLQEQIVELQKLIHAKISQEFENTSRITDLTKQLDTNSQAFKSLQIDLANSRSNHEKDLITFRTLQQKSTDIEAEIFSLKDQLTNQRVDKESEIKILKQQLANQLADKESEINVLKEQLAAQGLLLKEQEKLSEDRYRKIGNLEDRLTKQAIEHNREFFCKFAGTIGKEIY